MVVNETENLIGLINGLKVELATFRAEMKEFKQTVSDDVAEIGRRQGACQANPFSCANARRLDEHIKTDSGRLGRITGIIACVISMLSFLFVLIEKLT